MSLDLTVAVASHKPYWMPTSPCYQPVLVGSAVRGELAPQGWARDDSYEGNISGKNGGYCELTALHWLWKANDSDYAGLVHYRRHFSSGPFGSARRRVADEKVFERRLVRVPLVLPRPRDYIIETNYSQYAHAHHACDLDHTRDVLAERYPKVAKAWDDYMVRTSGHRFNIIIARRDVLDSWCSFLFDVLAELEQRIDTTGYSDNDRRVFGFLAERLLDPWVEANGIPYAEKSLVNLEPQHWVRKGASFVGRKLGAS